MALPEEWNDMTERILHGIDCPADLREVAREDLEQVASELRQEILENISQTGGHLSLIHI